MREEIKHWSRKIMKVRFESDNGNNILMRYNNGYIVVYQIGDI